MSLPYTSMLTGIFAIMMVVLTLLVSLRRRQIRVSLGDGNDETLRRRIRAHGNFAEFVPFALIALGLIELADGPVVLVTGMAIALLLSRLIHAVGILYSSTSSLRTVATVIQHTTFIVMGLWLLAGIQA